MFIPRHILTALLPICLFTGAIMPGMLEESVAQEIPADTQDRESLLAEGDRLFQQGEAQFEVSQFQEALISFEAALEIYRNPEIQNLFPQQSRQLEGRSLTVIGDIYQVQGRYDEALEYYQQALTIARDLGDRPGIGQALTNIGGVYAYWGQYQQALDFSTEALAIRQNIGDRAGVGETLTNIGGVYASLGQYQQALDFFSDALTILQDVGNRADEGAILNNIGFVYDRLGAYQQALSFYTEALAILQDIGDRAVESVTLNNIGVVYDRLGQYQQALSFYTEALAILQDIGNRSGEGTTLNNIGAVYDNLGEYQQALSFYTDALAIHREVGNRTDESTTLNNIGAMYENLGQYQQALSFYRDALAIIQDIGDRAGEGATLNNMGAVYDNLGQYQQALSFYTDALAIVQDIGDRAGEGSTLNNIGLVYTNLGQYQQALTFYTEALAIVQDIGDRSSESSTLTNIGVVYCRLGQYQQALDAYTDALAIVRDIGDRNGEGTVLNNIGLVYDNLEQYQQSLTFYTEALAIVQDIGDRRDEAATLGNLGSVYQSLGQYQQAFVFYTDALTILQDVGDREGEAIALNNIGFALESLEEPELAIVFFKQSVNRWEAIRGDIQELDIEQQQSFSDRISFTYRRLADLLLAADRVLEAQEVLDLLKLQELEEYNLRNVQGTDETHQGLEFWQAEREILELFETYIATDSEQDFEAFINRPEITERVAQLHRNARSQNLNPEQLIRLQDNLRQAGNAALLYPLILDDRLELVLVTTEGLVRETVPIDRVTLNEAIVSFRRAITDRRRNPTAQAQQLYQWLIAPLDDDLALADSNTILYAADGTLRYIPLAALHDGSQWLTQRFTINHITAASLTDFSQSGAVDLRILAGAFPNESIEVNLGTGHVWFSGLPFAQQEVENLVNRIPNTIAFFSEEFSRTAIEPHLNDYRVVHLATHAEFRSGHPTDSFILLGDGDRITLFDLDRWQLPDVDLVVLSACKTAMNGENLSNGEEILGFGYQIQRTGARGAIASLWSVDDGGTQVLMNGFYAAMEQNMPSAEALRQAQIALITGDYAALGIEPDLQEFLSLNHPYYWSPFILIGNGL